MADTEIEVTGEMKQAAHEAVAVWNRDGQSGSPQRAAYLAMLSAAGYTDEEVHQEMMDYTIEQHRAGEAGEEAWRVAGQQGGELNKYAYAFRAMRGAKA
jgi:hypothetical protein